MRKEESPATAETPFDVNGGTELSAISQIQQYVRIVLSQKEPHVVFRGIFMRGDRTYSYTIKHKVGTPGGEGEAIAL